MKILAIILTTFFFQIALAEVDVTYDPASGVVHIPQVRVIGDDSGTNYMVEMINNSDGSFYIINITENVTATIFDKTYANQQFSLELMDITSVSEGRGAIPEGLLGISFYVNDVELFIDLSGFTPKNATYDELVMAINKGIQNLPAEYRGGFTVSLGASFLKFNPHDGSSYVGTQIILTSHLHNSISDSDFSWNFDMIDASKVMVTTISEIPVYFNQDSSIIKITENVTATIFDKTYANQQFSLELMDITSVIEGGEPIPEGLLGISLSVNDGGLFIDLSGFTPKIATYDELLMAIYKGIQNLPAEYRGGFTVSLGDSFLAHSPYDGSSYVGTSIVLTSHLHNSISDLRFQFDMLERESRVASFIITEMQ